MTEKLQYVLRSDHAAMVLKPNGGSAISVLRCYNGLTVSEPAECHGGSGSITMELAPATARMLGEELIRLADLEAADKEPDDQ